MKGIYFLLIAFAITLIACNNANKKVCIAKENNCICTKDYRPVCGCDGVTYSNKCVAECVGIIDNTEGKCKEN